MTMATAKPCILVVDDSSDGREMLAEYLTFRGFSVVEASNGGNAIDLVHKRRPAVILMDLQMPGIDGWDATRQLKANPNQGHHRGRADCPRTGTRRGNRAGGRLRRVHRETVRHYGRG
jgi:CheY-like chemotaxis protein